MKEIGKEIIEISGVNYILFLNRKGIVAWEKFAKDEADIVKEIGGRLATVNEPAEIKEDTNPFEGLEVIDEYDKENEAVTTYYQKLYWIMLYDEHKFSFEKAKEIYNLACEEYGEGQVIALAVQMLEDANDDLQKEQHQKEVKNLKALRPTR